MAFPDAQYRVEKKGFHRDTFYTIFNRTAIGSDRLKQERMERRAK